MGSNGHRNDYVVSRGKIPSYDPRGGRRDSSGASGALRAVISAIVRVLQAIGRFLARLGGVIATGVLAFVAWLNLKPYAEMSRRERRVFHGKLVESLGLPVAILFLEIVFKESTTGGFLPSLLFLLLFSLSVGLLGYLLCSIFRNRVANFIIKELLFILLGVLFCVEYYVYAEFKVFYDLKTVIGGAGGVAGQFGGDVLGLIFNPSGLLHLFLYLAPAIVYPILIFQGRDHAHRATIRLRAVAAVGAVLTYLLAVILIAFSGAYGFTYTSRYSYQSCVTNFGLVTATRKDIQKGIGGSGSSIVIEETDDSSSSSSSTASTAVVEYGDNVTSIDFDALDKSSDKLTALDQYVSSVKPTSKNAMTGKFSGYNLIFISAEAFSAEVIDPTLTPTLYRLATKGIQFTDYYQPASAGTTGGETNNLFGVLPVEGGQSIPYMADNNNYFTMGSMLNRLGYNGWAFHDNDYTYYDRDVTHNTLGYNNGFMGMGNGMEAYVTDQWPEDDLEMMQGTFENIYSSQEPFNIYYMSVSGHSTYSQSSNNMSAKNWDEVADLSYSDTVKAYLAAQIELDKALEYLVNALEENGMADHTCIVISADHFPYGLDESGSLGDYPYLSELYGYDVTTLFERDHNRLILWSGSLEDEDPIVVDDPVCSIDVLPTLLNLFGLDYDSRLLPGRDVFSDSDPLVFDTSYDWKTNEGTYYASSGTFTPADGAATVTQDYIDKINAIVSNKMSLCYGVVDWDYWGHVYGTPEDTQTVHDENQSTAEAIAETDKELESAATSGDSGDSSSSSGTST